jgi:hypothetical protein
VQVYADFRREVVWGAVAVVGGAVYVPTASYCDRPMEGKVIRVAVATRAVTTWVSVPRSLGGGGGIWGWGGIAYSPQRNSLLVVTGNAFEGGRNRGRVYRATAGYGEQLVELSPDLQVRSSSRPTNLHPTGDFDFVGSPVPFVDSRCGELAATLNKNGRLYVWRTAAIPNGTISSLRIASTTLAKPLFTQLAYSERAHALYAVTYRRLLRIDIRAGCRARVTWSRRLGLDLANSCATVAGNLVWFVRTGPRSALLGVDAGTGAVRFRGLVGAPGLVAPTVLGNRIYFGSLAGELHGFALVPR